MQITSGLEPGQVLQQGITGTASLSLQGTCSGPCSGPVTVFVSLQEGALQIKPHTSGEANSGRWKAQVEDLPAGGPYQIEMICGDERCQVDNIYVGDLWVLAGQSNMEGVGRLRDIEPSSPQVRALTLTDRWQFAEEPLHWLFESVDSAHWPCEPETRCHFAAEHRSSRTTGAGLGLPFGVALSSALGVPVGLIPTARGGTSMQQWSPELSALGGDSLYGAMLRRIRKVGGVKGILWYQGESDANPVDSALFAGRFQQFISSVRSDLDAPDLPVLFVQLGRFVSPGTAADIRAWNAVQEAQRQLSGDFTAVAAAIDLELDDAIHIGTDGLRRLGRRLALLARTTVYSDTTLAKGPQLDRVSLQEPGRDLIRVHYAGVNSSLRSAGRLSGFSLRDLDGAEFPIIFKQEIDPSEPATVLLWLSGALPAGLALHYGWGRDPYCNLTDNSDLAALVFGPLQL